MRDEAGKSSYLRMTADLSFSYMKQLDGSRYRAYDQFLIGGLNIGLGQHSLDFSKLWFSSQFDLRKEQIDFNLPNQENIDATSSVYPNVNAGLLWYAVFDENKSLYFGGAAHHVNAPRISFISQDGEEVMQIKWAIHGGGELPFNKSLSVLPAFMVLVQGPSLLGITGANFRYSNHDWKEIAIRAGAWVHIVKDFTSAISIPALSFVTIIELERLGIGISYDVGINKLAAPTNGRGALELSVIYYHPAQRREKVNCPKL
jgi:type IX secretion system PorP/SprF family membrane protein